MRAAQVSPARGRGAQFDFRHALRRRFALLRLPVALAVPALGLPAWSAAQLLPDAGSSLRELRPEAPGLPGAGAPSESDRVLPALPPSAPSGAALPGGQTVRLRGIELSGNTVIDTPALQALLADGLAQPQDLAGLQALAQRVTDHYRGQGYLLARAYLPAQRLDDGVLRIEILEGRLGGVTLDNQSRVRDAALAGPLSRLRVGEALRAGALDSALLLASELPGVQLHGTLRPGAAPGTTDLWVRAEAGAPVSALLEADNYGSRYTGRYRLGGSLQWNSPLGLGDALYLRLLGTDKKQFYGRALYHVPVGPWSTRVGVGYSALRYELADQFRALDAHGTARTASAFILQPLWRARAGSLNLQLQFDERRLRDRIGVVGLDRAKRLRAWTVSLSGHVRDHWLGGEALTRFSLQHVSGHLSLNDAAHRIEDGLSARTRGSYHKQMLWVAREQHFSPRWQLLLQGQAQWSSRNLDSSEKFSLGGAYGVRAYPQGEAAGDEGWLLNAELRYRFAPGWQASVFVDHGRVRLQRRAWVAGSNHRELSGAGLGLAWSGSGWQVSTSLAWRLGGERPAMGKDRQPRLWLQVAKAF